MMLVVVHLSFAFSIADLCRCRCCRRAEDFWPASSLSAIIIATAALKRDNN